MPAKSNVKQSKRKGYQATAGARIARQLSNYYKQRAQKRYISKQFKGVGGTYPVVRSVYASGVTTSAADPQYRIEITDGQYPIRIWNGAAWVNYDQMNFEFRPGNLFVYFGISTGASPTYIYNYPIPGYTDCSALYDQGQIQYVELEFFFGQNMAANQNLNPASTLPFLGFPLMLMAKDYDDVDITSTTPQTIISQYSNHQVWQLGTMPENTRHVIRVKPRMAAAMVDVTGGGTFTAVDDTKKMWFDTVKSGQAPHYGIKTCFSPCSDVVTTLNSYPRLGVLSFRVTYHYLFKNIK